MCGDIDSYFSLFELCPFMANINVAGPLLLPLISSFFPFHLLSCTHERKKCFWTGLWCVKDVNNCLLDGDRGTSSVFVLEDPLCAHFSYFGHKALQRLTPGGESMNEWVINRLHQRPQINLFSFFSSVSSSLHPLVPPFLSSLLLSFFLYFFFLLLGLYHLFLSKRWEIVDILGNEVVQSWITVCLLIIL